MTTTPANPYLEGNFGPVHEEVTLTDLPVTGRIPEHLDGRYLRNGPNPIVAPDPSRYHWFMGDGMVHGLRLRDGRAEWYRNRWSRSVHVADTLGEPHPSGTSVSGFDLAPNTNVIGHAGRTFAIVEAGSRPYELTDELDTVGACDFDGTLPGGYTAHPKRDPETGELHAVSYFWAWGKKLQYTVIDPQARVRRIVDIEVTGSPMVHDFSLTERHVVVYDLPVTFSMAHVEAGDAFPYRWDADYPARVGVMDRDSDGSDIRWFDVDPCYVFHPLNAYDEGSTVVLDVVRHPSMFDTERRGPSEGPPNLHRWTVDLAGGKVIETLLDDRVQEFPRVDERVVGRRHRFGYTAGNSPEAQGNFDLADTVIRHDLEAGTTDVRTFGAGDRVGEFVFVPSSHDAAEDDGTLMGLVYHASSDTSDLVLLDAATLETAATVQLPVRVPFGFHGNWVPA